MRLKQLLPLFLLLGFLLTGLGQARVQAQVAHMYGTSPFQDSMWAIDTTSWTVVRRLAPSLPGFTITGMTGLTYDPCGHQTYIIMKVSGVSGRVLGTIDLQTGVCTQVGNLGDNFSTICFREDGQLFGVTGDGATVPETLYLIDKTNGSKTVAAALGGGADGEVISYNWDDNFFYHWSGNGTVVMERVMSIAPYTATNIPTSGAPGGETFGSIYMGSNKFINSNISSALIRCNTTGAYGTGFTSNPDDLRGLVLPPDWELLDDTVCVNESIEWANFAGITYQDTTAYLWGDGDSTNVFPVGGATHMYATAGSYMVYVVLKNSCGRDTLDSAAVVINALPGVVLSPDPAYLCDSLDTLTLSGSTGGSSQWYMNGAPIVGATTPTYDATAPGWYNMTKTNLNGCTDSSAVGLNVMFAPTSVDMLSPSDSTHFCPGDTLTLIATAGAVSYEWWLNGTPVDTTTSDSFWVTMPGDWDVMAWYGDCAVPTTGDITLIEDPLPVAAFSYVDNGDSTVTFTDGSTDATSWAWDFGDGSGTSTLPNPTYDYGTDGVFVVTLIVTNSCGSDTITDSTQVLVGLTAPTASGFSLSNQPNPFSDRTTFVVNSLSASEASLTVYNVHGQVIRTLHSGLLTAGEHRFEWDGRSSNGLQVASGTYQAVLRTANGQVSRQVLLAK